LIAESTARVVEATPPRSTLPRAARKRLRENHPAMAAILESIFRHDLAA
jgi:hypothetical protein